MNTPTHVHTPAHTQSLHINIIIDCNVVYTLYHGIRSVLCGVHGCPTIGMEGRYRYGSPLLSIIAYICSYIDTFCTICITSRLYTLVVVKLVSCTHSVLQVPPKFCPNMVTGPSRVHISLFSNSLVYVV